ncbi:hypothetical protein L873DRAFT_1731872 [Choiromyces venosus 120613-1]|uniref:lytic cellulose monooxygenase (C4-dehydrogenating) n=1 Tax=Choiromyces venosus 120613-1 TaxID=1336337 RepID=A0A3N4KBQ3_9PEZI|nr:hypothetical protein L873DRAFT_1731872 [Choiromyces venosus 120613-1]
MKPSFILSALGAATGALAHGLVSQILIDGTLYDNYSPYIDPYKNPKPERIGWTTPGNGPVGVTAAGMACNTGSTAGSLSAPATAGSSIKFFWTVWPESHRGPTMTYLAKCPGTDCTTADPTTLNWFKIDHAGLNADRTWISDTIVAQNSTWTVTIPSDIASGPYLLRHELLALHAAFDANGAQPYPMCANLQITGTGSAVPTDTVKFPGGYSPTDPGILINIYYPAVTNYTIPGPAPYVPGGGSAPISSSVVASSPRAATSAPAVSTPAGRVPTTSILAVPTTTTFTGTGYPIPTLAPSAVPPYGNNTRTRTSTKFTQTTRIVAAPSSKVAPISETSATPTKVAAVPTPVVPVVSTVIQTVGVTQVPTMTVPAAETVTATQSRRGGQAVPEYTPAGRHRRSIYGYGI